jgi:hypothetical protein
MEETPTVPVCDICGKPLAEAEVKLHVTCHFPCMFKAAYADVTDEEA